MRIKIFILLYVILLTHICAKSQPVKRSAIDGVYKFSGKLNGKISVFLWLVVQDSVVKGEVTYLKNAKRVPITVLGTITKDDGLRLFEFTKSGDISGIYSGAFNPGSLTGTWLKPGSQKVLKYIFTSKDTILNNPDIDLTPVTPNGEYSYQFGEKGATGTIDLKPLGGVNYLMEISCVTDGPAYNLADIGNTKVRMSNNTIIYKVPGANCKFKIRIFKNFIVVDMVTANIDECGFGNNANIDGVFIKTSGIAKFEKNSN